MPKTWRQKYENGRSPVVETLDKPFAGIPAGAKLLISTPAEVDELVSAVPKGQTITVPEIRDQLAKRHQADGTCPLTTGIFLRIVAECALEGMSLGKENVTPFWRAIDPKSPLAKKLSCGSERIAALRSAER